MERERVRTPDSKPSLTITSNKQNLLIFGSFTEEETRNFQKQPVDSGKPSTESMCLQFGSLNFDSTLLSRSLRPKTMPQGLSPVSKGPHVETFTKTKGNISQKVPQKSVGTYSNGSINANYLTDRESSLNEKSTEIVTAACVSTELVPEPEDVDEESSNDVTSIITTENSFENEIILDTPLKATIGEDIHTRETLKSQNGGLTAQKPLLPCGLINSGNLCFLNATLQALLSCSPFVDLLQHLRTCDIPKTGFSTLHALVEFISGFDMPDQISLRKNDPLVIETGKPFSPLMFETVLKKFTPDLAINISGRPRQEDAQEFLSFAMDRMHNELLKLDENLSNSDGVASSLVSAAEDDGWETVGPKNKSAVTRTHSFVRSELSDIFGGELRSVVKARGNKASATIQPFLLLHLDISPDAVHSIEDALHLFSAPETLEGYKTSAGKSMTSASKSVKILKASKILILHLMRFSYGSKGAAKLHKPVHFSPELVLSRDLLVSPTSEGRRYELVATVTHHGKDPSKGHYTADARYHNGKWLRYDDASVTLVAMSKVLHDYAYLLFYKQV